MSRTNTSSGIGKKFGANPKGKAVKRWSYSAWAGLMSCPMRFFRSYVLGERGPKVPAMERGNEIHKLAEFYLTRRFDGVPPELKRLKPEYLALRKEKPIVEQFWGVDQRWKTKEWNSWCVIKMDAVLPPKKMDGWLWLQDLKTGREYPDHWKQGSLYGAVGLSKYPDLEGVISEFWYADQPVGKNTVTYTFPLKEVKALKEYWLEQGEQVMQPRKLYLPQPSENACRWCHLRSDKGGWNGVKCDGWKTVKELKAGSRR